MSLAILWECNQQPLPHTQTPIDISDQLHDMCEVQMPNLNYVQRKKWKVGLGWKNNFMICSHKHNGYIIHLSCHKFCFTNLDIHVSHPYVLLAHIKSQMLDTNVQVCHPMHDNWFMFSIYKGFVTFWGIKLEPSVHVCGKTYISHWIHNLQLVATNSYTNTSFNLLNLIKLRTNYNKLGNIIANSKRI